MSASPSTPSTTAEMVPLASIDLGGSIQVRASMDYAVVAEYADAMKDGQEFPAVLLFQDGERFIISDGFHRIHAAAGLGWKGILANVLTGTKADALLLALRANSSHGLRRTNADKRRAVQLALEEWPTFPTRKLAERCAVSHNFVAEVRRLSSDDKGASKAKAKRQKPWRGMLLRYSRATLRQRGEIAWQLIGMAAKVSVPDKAAFARRINQWLEKYVEQDAKGRQGK